MARASLRHLRVTSHSSNINLSYLNSLLQFNMAVPRNSLRGFLTHARGALRTAIDSNQNITFVIGNESAGEQNRLIPMAL
jgi:hypothetical protein